MAEGWGEIACCFSHATSKAMLIYSYLFIQVSSIDIHDHCSLKQTMSRYPGCQSEMFFLCQPASIRKRTPAAIFNVIENKSMLF